MNMNKEALNPFSLSPLIIVLTEPIKVKDWIIKIDVLSKDLMG